MTLIRWVVIAVELACFIAVFLIVWSYRRELEDVKADRDELAGEYPTPAARIAALTADLAEQQVLTQQTRTRLLQLAQHVTANDQPSTGRHAHSEARAA